VYDFGREVSRYSGRDSDGAWTEGSPRDRARIARVPGGRYFLRVEADRPPEGGPVHATLRVKRDVPSFLPMVLAIVALFIPPFILAIRRASFEQTRWQESDYASVGEDDDEGDDE
jgi:hypothetical protein